MLGVIFKVNLLFFDLDHIGAIEECDGEFSGLFGEFKATLGAEGGLGAVEFFDLVSKSLMYRVLNSLSNY